MSAPVAQKEQIPRPPSLVTDRLRALLTAPQVDLSQLSTKSVVVAPEQAPDVFIEANTAADTTAQLTNSSPSETMNPTLSEHIDSQLSDMESVLDEIKPTVEPFVEDIQTAPVEQFVQPVPEQQPVVLESTSPEGNQENEALSEYLQEVRETETPVEALKDLVNQAQEQTGKEVTVTFVPSTEKEHEEGKKKGPHDGGRWLYHLVKKLIDSLEARGLLAAFKREPKPVQ